MSHASLLVSAIGHTFILSKFAITVLVICLSFSSSRWNTWDAGSFFSWTQGYLRERTVQLPLAALISIEQKPIKHSVSSSFFRFFSVQLGLQPDPVTFLQLQDGTSRSLLVAIPSFCLLVPDLGAIPHETHFDSTLKQLNVKAKLVHARDAAGEHASGRAEVALMVVQNFLEDNGLGGSWERPTQLDGKGRLR